MRKWIIAATMAGALLASPAAGEAALGDQTLKSGMKHSDVKELQQVLKAKGYYKSSLDTTFGPLTKSAVIRLQKANGLTADGIVGKNTFRVLGKTTSKSTASASSKTSTVAYAKKFIGVPYKWGGATPSGFDCSGFLTYVYKNSAKISLPRTVAGIYSAGKRTSSPKVGDIVFFETYQKGASHAGIYLGNNQFIHSSTSAGVTISSLKSSYWSKRYIGAKTY
ncbi:MULTISPECIES: NlpC/P60 family protein [Bacillaceae]|uniref:C40 family peptidase n=1 Tax=Bacillaceae TaxID=186817 RepID=UPI000E71E9AE|nr:NlpC/P60 family protein [Bacillus sp. PK3_68]RJS59072.1 endopeptidase [Bacillus sp. PK3_68]